MPDARANLPLTETTGRAMREGARVDEDMIRRVVYGIYDRVREDALLGPVFMERVGDWPTHLEKMVDFWSAAILRTGRYHGRPAAAHALIEGISTDHFQHWLGLFAATVRDLCPPAEAALFTEMANRLARGLTATLRLRAPVPVTA